MTLNASNLRANLYKILDQVIKTGKPIAVERDDERVEIIAVRKRSKFDYIKAHPGTTVDDPESYVHIDWSKNWKYDDFS